MSRGSFTRAQQIEKQTHQALDTLETLREHLQQQIYDVGASLTMQVDQHNVNLHRDLKDAVGSMESMTATVALDYSHFIGMRWQDRWRWLLTGRVPVRKNPRV